MAAFKFSDNPEFDKARLLAYIEERTIPEPNSGCWLWLLSCGNHGYGQLGWYGRKRTAHRLSWQAHHGDIPAGLCVLHKCDVRSCCNPDHLFLGTRPDNMADMVAKGRSTKGERNPTKRPEVAAKLRGAGNGMYGRGYLTAGERAGSVKLKEAEVRLIRASVGPETAVAAVYGISRSLVGLIRRRQVWRYLSD